MNVASYIFSIFTAILVLVIVIEMLRRGRLRERHAIWWLLAGGIGLTIGIFPSILSWLAQLLGVQDPINLAFFVSTTILFLALLQQSSEVTKLEEKTRALVEAHALLEIRVRELEKSELQ
jgi:hypothetical protein